MIRDRLKAAQGRQKSYVDIRHRDFEFKVRDRVYLKVSSIKRVMQFGKKVKLSSLYVRTYVVLMKVGNVAYELELPSSFISIYLVFHVFKFRKCIGDPSSVVPLEGLGISDSLSYEEIQIEILDR